MDNLINYSPFCLEGLVDKFNFYSKENFLLRN